MDDFQGSTVLSPISDAISIPLDQINMLTSRLAAVIIALTFRKYCSRQNCSAHLRNTICVVIGVAILNFNIGPQQTLYLVGVTGFVYLCLRLLPIWLSPGIVLGSTMVLLAKAHYKRFLGDPDADLIDWTIPFLIFVQKFSGVAFSLYDGFACDPKSLTYYRKEYAIRQMPSMLEFFSYIFNFMGVIGGPNSFFVDYKDFIDHDRNSNKPVGKVVAKKLAMSGFFCVLGLIADAHFPARMMAEEAVISKMNFMQILFYSYIAALPIRFKFYFFWLLADGLNNAAGFGYRETEKDWDLIANIQPVTLETTRDSKRWAKYWNIQTTKWLRLVCFERSPKSVRTQLTFLLSVLWHGFFPGYYVIFLTAFIAVEAQRITSKKLTPYFKSRYPKLWDVVCFVGFHMALDWAVVNHVNLVYSRILVYNRYAYGYGIILTTLGLFFPYDRVIPQGDKKKL